MKLSYLLASKIKNTDSKTFSGTIIKVGILSISLAVIVLILAFFILKGFKEKIQDKLFAQTSHIQICKFTLNRSFEEASVTNNLDWLPKLKNNPTISSINKVALKSVILKTNDKIEGLVLKGVESQYDWNAFRPSLVKGKFPNNSGKEIMISNWLSNKMDVKIGQNITLFFLQDPPRARNLKVSGIYDTGIEEFDKIYVYSSLGLIQKVNKWESAEFGHLEVFLRNIDQIDKVKQAILNAVPQSFNVQTAAELLPQFYDWFNLLDRNILLVLVLIVIVTAFNIFSILIIMIMERTPMIGVMKSLGASTLQISSIFYSNTFAILIKGLIWGNLIGLAIAFVQSKYKLIKLDAQSYYMKEVPISWDFKILLYINIGIILWILIISIFPLLLTKRIKILNAIKYKD